MRKTPEEIQIMLDEHWEYVEGVLVNGQPVNEEINIARLTEIRYHYRTAFIHGYKHGIQDVIEQIKIDKRKEVKNGKGKR